MPQRHFIGPNVALSFTQPSSQCALDESETNTPQNPHLSSPLGQPPPEAISESISYLFEWCEIDPEVPTSRPHEFLVEEQLACSARLARRVRNTIENLLHEAAAHFSTKLKFSLRRLPLPGCTFHHEVLIERAISQGDFFNFLAEKVYHFKLETQFAYIHDSALYVGIGFESFQSARLDRTIGSRVDHFLQQPPLLSDHRAQIASLALVSEETQVDMPLSAFQNLTMISTFLRYWMRLNHSDIRIVTEHLSHDSRWHLWPVMAVEADETASNWLGEPNPDNLCRETLLERAKRSLWHAANSGYRALIETAFQSMASLEALDKYQGPVSVAERHVSSCWLVFAHHKSRKVLEHLRRLKPSFFNQFHVSTPADPHVHLIDCQVMGLMSVMAIAFRTSDEPGTPMVGMALHSILTNLGVPLLTSGRWLVTDPLFYRNVNGPIFRSDGLTSISFVSKHVSPEMRAAIDNARRWLPSQPPLRPYDQLSMSRAEELRQPRLLIIWLRASITGMGRSLGRQLWIIINHMPSVLAELRPHDKVVVALEHCSSVKHGWGERFACDAVLKWLSLHPGHESYVLTAWADRLTRRVEDLNMIGESFDKTSTTWMFRQLAENVDGDQEVRWLSSIEDNEGLRASLINSKEIGLQASHYLRLFHQLNRTIKTPRMHPSIVALKAVLRTTFLRHKIMRIVIYVRVSPTGRKYQVSGEDIVLSIERQVEVISRIIPEGYHVKVIRDIHKSAYCGSPFRQSVMPIIQEEDSRACVISISLDRVLRRSEMLTEMFHTLGKHSQGHFAMCLFWD